MEDPDDRSPALAGYDSDSEKVDLGDDLFMYADTRVRTHNTQHVIEVRVGVHAGRLAADEVSVRRRDGDAYDPVTSEVLRSIPVAKLVRYAAATVQHVMERRDDGSTTTGPAWPQETEFEGVTLGLNDPTLRIVARIYRVAYMLGDPPTRQIERLLLVPRSTAGRWVAAARQREFLSESRGPGKAGG